MNSIIKDHPSITEKNNWKLTAFDVCDKCNSQALVKVDGKSGCLYFCGHHYNKIIKTSSGYANLMGFAQNVTDERKKLE
jgi:hypothetical protein